MGVPWTGLSIGWKLFAGKEFVAGANPPSAGTMGTPCMGLMVPLGIT
jgi:hypothetical protein